MNTDMGILVSCPGCGNRIPNAPSTFCPKIGKIIQLWKEKETKSIYIIGALKNDVVKTVANMLRLNGYDAFDDWITPGPEADQFLLAYEKQRGRGYKEALKGYAAQHNFTFDKSHIDRCDMAVMVMPAGKSGHLELGYVIGSGKKGYILFDQEPDRMDLMYNFATDVFFSVEELLEALRKD